MSEIKYLKHERLKSLHESIGFLNDYKLVENEIHHIGRSLNNKDKKLTEMLFELGKINQRREDIINLMLAELG